MNARATFYDFGTNRPRTPAGENVLRRAILDSMKPKTRHIRKPYRKPRKTPATSKARVKNLCAVLRSISRGNTLTSGIADDTGIKAPTVRNYLKSLELDGYITRTHPQEVWQVKNCEITERGRDYMVGKLANE